MCCCRVKQHLHIHIYINPHYRYITLIYEMSLRGLLLTPRFDHWPFVLGHQGFASGRHCWDVDVGDGGDWAVGVARESVPRKGRLSLGPQGGIWGLEKWGGQVRALTARKVTPVAPRGLPRRVSVHLDCGGGTVAFFDARDGGLLFAFSRVAFAGERVRPWLWVVGARSHLRVCP
uniref:B30.2/SPRY domain-containing protein n=1 Tax=Cyanoderma ruficeps TaxID=181631 RepID=A0A8C3RGR0_9PASS